VPKQQQHQQQQQSYERSSGELRGFCFCGTAQHQALPWRGQGTARGSSSRPSRALSRPYFSHNPEVRKPCSVRFRYAVVSRLSRTWPIPASMSTDTVAACHRRSRRSFCKNVPLYHVATARPALTTCKWFSPRGGHGRMALELVSGLILGASCIIF
jgi:hypothetical protein